MQDINLNQLKLKVIVTYKKTEKITTNFEHSNNENVLNKASLYEKLSKLECHLSLLEKDYFEHKLLNDNDTKRPLGLETPNKQSEEVLIETAIQILYDQGLFDNYDKADEVLKDYLLIDEVNDRLN